MEKGEIDTLTYKVIGCAMEVHKHLGPGLLESVYEAALCREFELQGIPYIRQFPIQVRYKDTVISNDLRVDLIVYDSIVVELKSIEKLAPIHCKQTLTYMRLLRIKKGLLINFNEAVLKDGIKRILD